MEKTKKSKKSNFAENVISARKALGWKAEKLAEKAEIPYPTLRDIEAGISAGRAATKAKIAKALGREMWQLDAPPGNIEGTGFAAPQILKDLQEIKTKLDQKNGPSMSPEKEKLVGLLPRLNDKQTARVIRFIHTILSGKPPSDQSEDGSGAL